MVANVTEIPAPRVAFIDEKTGLISREWYRFLLNLFTLSGSGQNVITLSDVQLVPETKDYSGDFDDLYQKTQLLLSDKYDFTDTSEDINQVTETDTIKTDSNQVLLWLSM